MSLVGDTCSSQDRNTDLFILPWKEGISSQCTQSGSMNDASEAMVSMGLGLLL